MAGSCLTFNTTCQVDCTSIQQKFLCQGCLTGIRVRDNGKSSSFFYFVRVLRHVCPPVCYPNSNFYTTFYFIIDYAGLSRNFLI